MNFLKKILSITSNAKNQTSSDSINSIKELKKVLANETFSLLKQKGFRRQGMTFSLTQNDLIFFIQIQSSPYSTTAIWMFTLNIGIVSLKLCQLTDIAKPTYLDSHWRKRIGFYLNPPSDKWWSVSNNKSFESSKKEIIELLEREVLPDIFSFQTTEDLQAFWLQGNYQGLTKVQQEYYLKLLQ